MKLIKGQQDEIFQEVLPLFAALCKNERGLNVMKKMIIELKDLQAQLNIIEIVRQNGNMFIEDCYCNYAIQLIVQIWPNEITSDIFKLICGKILSYCLERSSSNVVETMIIYSPSHIKKLYFDEILSLSNVHGILLNSYITKLLWQFCNAKGV